MDGIYWDVDPKRLTKHQTIHYNVTPKTELNYFKISKIRYTKSRKWFYLLNSKKLIKKFSLHYEWNCRFAYIVFLQYGLNLNTIDTCPERAQGSIRCEDSRKYDTF